MRSHKHLYMLSYICPETNMINVFYIGKTDQPTRREREHKYHSKLGLEDKYVFIRELESKNIEWNFEVFKSIPKGDYAGDWEAFYVIQYVRMGHPIKNMKHGDLDEIVNHCVEDSSITIRTVKDVKALREQREREQYEKSEQLKNRVGAGAVPVKPEEKERGDRVMKVYTISRNIFEYMKKCKWIKGNTELKDAKFKRWSKKTDDKREYYIKCYSHDLIATGNSYEECYSSIARMLSKKLLFLRDGKPEWLTV